MRNRLQAFTDFTNQLLPHETAYLLRTHRLEDQERIAILERVDHNCRQIQQFTPYDPNINKRKYHHLKLWIEERLQSIDVDVQHDWLLQLERKIMTDTIEPADEKKLLKMVRRYEHPAYYFMKLYEVLQHYRHFLQIRLRYRDHKLVDDFVRSYAEQYDRSKKCYDHLHAITQDVVGQYAEQSLQSDHWQDLLEGIFMDTDMDGLNRYLALVRLTFIGFNYRNYDRVLQHFDQMDKAFTEGKHYSRRLLTNYYGNRLLLHSQRKEYEKAVYYGRLSVRARNYDYLFYVNNLAAVLLRLNQRQQALQLLQSAREVARETVNPHNRIGYVAFYLEALIKNGRTGQAESYGDTYLRAYRKDILRYRWHLFFTIYLQAILLQGRYEKILRLNRQYKLLEKDRDYSAKASYLPSIPVMVDLAQWREGNITDEDFQHRFQRIRALVSDGRKEERFRRFCEDLGNLLPVLVNS
ncbi:hypothetical protein [Lewinella sp. W8]|uniref:hypothetical protein n=1 Tax=Lewinella sp. W8 TaxID=2528208 RepID=UPI0010686742|nr:hypothetical protein [Lewinella sp. W8]MTB53437.1 hypothetical protein [Lewinella sp. W8]